MIPMVFLPCVLTLGALVLLTAFVLAIVAL